MTLTAPENIILGPNGRPISSKDFQNAKSDNQPKTGNAFGAWAGRDITLATLPGGGLVAFDLSKLTLADFRNMRDHYQIHSSLAVLSFLQHQSDFHIECDDKKIADFCDQQMHDNWTQLNRSMSQANWAGYSPNALEWDNNILTRKTDLVKIKDLVPEECFVNWKEELGWAPPGRTQPKFRTFDGINQFGVTGWPIPVENSFWYPLLMENGDYYGRKLLRPAFQPWFFSLLVHLFANRYYERFGEPTPVGRAPFDDTIQVGGKSVTGNAYMLDVLQQLRNRSVVILPNDRTENSSGRSDFDYDLEYLESQMRGADFERYLTRLDEEMSIGLFTPILLMRTADVGSYNLGVGHMQMYLWMLNAMNGDRAFYLDRYILSPMVDYNFSPNAPRARINFRKLGNQNEDMIRQVIVELIKQHFVEPDLAELGQALGMTLKEVTATTAPDPQKLDSPGSGGPTPTPSANPNTDGQTGKDGASKNRETIAINATATQARATASDIVTRIQGQMANGLRNDSWPKFNMGYKHRFERALGADGYSNAIALTNQLYDVMDSWLNDLATVPIIDFTEGTFISMFMKVLDNEISRIENAIPAQ